eukprot:scaffold17472_cov105-Isochrysis_galbana.AAC.7
MDGRGTRPRHRAAVEWPQQPLIKHSKLVPIPPPVLKLEMRTHRLTRRGSGGTVWVHQRSDEMPLA